MRTRAFAPLGLALLFAIFAISTVPSAHASSVVVATPEHCTRGANAAAVTHRAGLVVTFGSGAPTKTFCVEFSEDTISGLQLLERAASAESGLQPIVTSGGGLGGAVCAIGGVGSTDASSYSACFGKYPNYWAYYQYVAGVWQMSRVGASSSVVSDGSVEGWSWEANAKPDPPGTICPSPSATPTVAPIPAPSATPIASQAQPTAGPSTATSDQQTAQTSVPATEDVPNHPTVTGAPPDGDPQPPNAAASSPESAVEAAVRSPAAQPGAPTATRQSPSPTPRSSAIVVDAEQASRNEAHAESRTASGGGSRASLVVFAIIAGLLAAAAAGMVYRRRRAV